MRVGDEVTEQEMLDKGFTYDHDFYVLKVFVKDTQLVYLNTKTGKIDNIYDYSKLS